MNNELKHYGIPGMKWGIRRYQNPDGTLTAKGRAKYKLNDKYQDRQVIRDVDVYGHRGMKRINRSISEGHSISGARSLEANKASRDANASRAIKRGTSFVASAFATYGAHVAINQLSRKNQTVKQINDILGSYGNIGVSTVIGTAVGQAVGTAAGGGYMLAKGHNPYKTWRYT